MDIKKADSIRSKQIISLMLNAIIVVLEGIGLSYSIRSHGVSLFQYYTELSNIFSLFACGILVFYTAKNLRANTPALPRWVKNLKYMAACCLTVTLLVVVFVLSPMSEMGGLVFLMFHGSMLYHHLLCPILVLVSFIFFEPIPRLEPRSVKLALVPTVAYGVVAFVLNLLGVMDGPYPFLKVYDQPAWMSVLWTVLIFGGAYLIARCLLFLNKRFSNQPITAD